MKRRLLMLAVFLLAGAVVNVGVAWGCSLSLNRETFLEQPARMRWGYHRSARGWWEITRVSLAGSTLIVAEHYYTDHEWLPASLVSAPEWVNLDDLSVDNYPDPTREARLLEAHGWPMLVLWFDYGLDEYGDIIAVRGGMATQGFEPEADIFCVAASLPLRPIWPGFAVNTLFYAAVLWLLICGPFALRRFIRLKRGLCPACAYPRGEAAVCSECGLTRSGTAIRLSRLRTGLGD